MSESRPVPPSLKDLWNASVEQFATLTAPVIEDGHKERHRIYSLLLSGLLYDKWNGNKCGEVGDYGKWRTEQILGNTSSGQKIYCGGSYLGHNIAALAVDGDGRIMDFDFNHNDVFDSTVEHAESRLVRRLFALTQIYSPAAALAGGASKSIGAQGFAAEEAAIDRRRTVFETSPTAPVGPTVGGAAFAAASPHDRRPVAYGSSLQDVTMYTTLESCAQCSGIMCLANLKEIVYLQWDQGQYLIGNMMWRATRDRPAPSKYGAPRPIRGDEFDFPYFMMLNDACADFQAKVVMEDGDGKPLHPFFADGHRTEQSPSVTSFLCTDAARAIFRQAGEELDGLSLADLKQPQWRPPEKPTALTNSDVLKEAKDFRDWAQQFQKVNLLGSRGAPHRV